MARSNRRQFIKSTAALGAGAWVLGGVSPKVSLSANEEIRFACIGVGGKGSSDSSDAGRHGKVVAMCDIDANVLRGKTNEFPDAATYSDFRKMLDEMEDKIDAVTVSTPDHTHAVAALYAMQMGKHCFCQKPLTHSIEESRVMGELARRKNLVTQMGNQGTASTSMRISAALIRAGIIGTVKEVHVWTNRPVWPQSAGLQVPEAEVPAHIDWNSWIGPATMRPYSPEIHPFKWRGFWEFGTGALGDMACHTLNMSYMALDLKFPTSVEAVFDEHDKVFYPGKSKITFEFPEYNGRPALTMVWYDGGEKPDPALMADLPKQQRSGGEFHYDSGALLIGDKGKFYSPGDYGEIPNHNGIIMDGEFTTQRRIVRSRDEEGESPFSEFKNLEYVQSPGHFTEFANAIKGDGVPMSEFVNYAGPLTETILLGNLSLWSGKKIDWNAKEMVAMNADEEIQRIIRREYHNGYSIKEFAVSATG
jgi:predicted dehydrogenase